MPDRNDGCQYASCEDDAPDNQLVSDGDSALVVILCRRHSTYIRERLRDAGWRAVILEDEARARVKLLRVTAASRSAAA